MMLSDPDNPRHLRLFELMRQRDVAIARAGAVKAMPTRPLAQTDLEQVQMIALRSFGDIPVRRSDRP